ncbi:MAG: hypothetical protein ACK55Z_24445, partial [bacterium]
SRTYHPLCSVDPGREVQHRLLHGSQQIVDRAGFPSPRHIRTPTTGPVLGLHDQTLLRHCWHPRPRRGFPRLDSRSFYGRRRRLNVRPRQGLRWGVRTLVVLPPVA